MISPEQIAHRIPEEGIALLAKMVATIEEYNAIIKNIAVQEVKLAKSMNRKDQRLIDVESSWYEEYKSERSAIQQVIKDLFGCDISQLRVRSMGLKTVLDKHEELTLNLLQLLKVFRLLKAADTFDEDPESETSRERLESDIREVQSYIDANLSDASYLVATSTGENNDT